MTVLDLISASLKDIGVLASGETPTDDEANDAFLAFTNLLDSMSNERLLIYSVLREVFALTAGQQTYQWGSTATGTNFISPRPQRIENAAIQAYGTNPVAEIPVEILNKDQYAGIIVKTIQSSLPLYLYNDDAYPLANVNLWPVPNVPCSLVTYSWKALQDLATLQTTLSLPPGYNRMLQKHLAIELAPAYGKEPSDTLVAIAIQAKENVKRANSKPVYMMTDPALGPRAGAFNWLTGDTV